MTMTDDELGRILREAEMAEYGFTVPWSALHPQAHAFYVAAARAVRDAVLPPGSVVIDRETAEGALALARHDRENAEYDDPTPELMTVARHRADGLIAALTAALGEGE